MPSYPTRPLGRNGPLVSAIASALCASEGSTDQVDPVADVTPMKEARALFTYAANRGLTFWDTSFVYGESERLIGDWFAKTGRPSEISLATKFMKTSADTSYPLVEKSLQNLKMDYIDLYYRHRVNPTVPIEVVLEKLRPYVESGKINPLGGGFMTGRFKSRDDFAQTDIRFHIPRLSGENFPHNLKLVDKFRIVAEKYNVSPGQLTLAWIIARDRSCPALISARLTGYTSGIPTRGS
ncbi:NADP-dependent oxidoreductase domain-containing protein [Fomitopsis betulina]|nr:NADP-dependent oxidoreductase domain-containing protein [Fomitopsis betulina]